jgi:hypothetical protein
MPISPALKRPELNAETLFQKKKKKTKCYILMYISKIPLDGYREIDTASINSGLKYQIKQKCIHSTTTHYLSYTYCDIGR